MRCASCQSEIPAAASFCANCGASVGVGGGAAAAPAPALVTQTQGGLSDNAAGAIAYLTFIPAVIFLVMEPYNRSKFVRFHAFQCIGLTVVSVAAHIVVNFVPILGLFVSLALSLVFFIAWVACILKASKGEMFKLPLIGDFAEKQANS